MPRLDWLIAMGLGGLFILLGIVAILRGISEEKSYYNGISNRYDVREYVEHSPLRPEPGALKIGGRIAIIIGVLLLCIGAFFWFRA